jgi:hypothetical protein
MPLCNHFGVGSSWNWDSSILVRMYPTGFSAFSQTIYVCLESYDSIHSKVRLARTRKIRGLLTFPGLRSIFIADIHQTNAFSAGTPLNWKNLNHLFIHSPILLGLANQILSCCCNLVACLLEIVGQRDATSTAFFHLCLIYLFKGSRRL